MVAPVSKLAMIGEKLLAYGVPCVIGFSASFTKFFGTMESPTQSSILAICVTTGGIVLARLIAKLPELFTSRATAKRSREETLAAANDRLIQSLQDSLDVARLRADTAEEARELEKASKHMLQSYYGNACNHLQIRAELLRSAHIEFEDFSFTEVIALMKPYDERIRELMAAKTRVAREVVSKSATQILQIPTPKI